MISPRWPYTLGGPSPPAGATTYGPCALPLPRGLPPLPDPLTPPLCIGEGPVLFGEARRRQNDMGQLGRLSQENVLDHQEVKAAQDGFGLGHVRLAQEGVFSHEIETTDRPSPLSAKDLGQCHAWPAGDRTAPGRLEPRPDVRVVK